MKFKEFSGDQKNHQILYESIIIVFRFIGFKFVGLLIGIEILLLEIIGTGKDGIQYLQQP